MFAVNKRIQVTGQTDAWIFDIKQSINCEKITSARDLPFWQTVWPHFSYWEKTLGFSNEQLLSSRTLGQKQSKLFLTWHLMNRR